MEALKTLRIQLRALLTLAVLFSFLDLSWGQLDEEALTLCRNGKTVRSIRVEKTSDGCRTVYTKEGIDSQAGAGQFLQSCIDIAGNIQENLASGGWKCRNIKKAKISELGSEDAGAVKASE